MPSRSRSATEREASAANVLEDVNDAKAATINAALPARTVGYVPPGVTFHPELYASAGEREAAAKRAAKSQRKAD
jgi:hypothetical protein